MYHSMRKVKAGRGNGRGRGGRLAKKSGKVSATSVSDTSAATNMLSTTVDVTTTATSKASSTTTSSTISFPPARPPTSAAASTASAAPSSTGVMASYFYGIGKKHSIKQVELPIQSPPPMTLPVPLPVPLPSSPKKQLRETSAETECETFSSLPQENDFECDAPLSPTTADVLYSLTPQELQHDLQKVQEGFSVRSRTGSSSLFSSAANSPSPSVIIEEESCDDNTDLPSTPAISTSSPSVTVVATASTTGVLPAAAISAHTRDQQGQGASSRRSNVWKYFQTLEGGFFAKCKLCGKQVSRGKKLGHLTNAGMNLHIKNYHHSTLLRAEAEKEDGSAGSSITDSECTGGTSSTTPLTQSTANREGSFKTSHTRAVVPLQTQSGSSSSQGHHQPTLDSFVGFSSKGMSKQQANKITRLIGQFIAVGGASFRMIEGEPFKQLMHALAPRYVVPARTTFSRKIIPALYHSCVAVLKEKMAKAEGQTIHLTTDLWTAPSGQHAFLSLTAHWWQATVPVGGGTSVSVQTSSGRSAAQDQQGYQAFLLHTEVRDDKHSSANILRAIRSMLANWFGELAVTNVSVGFIVTDGGSNMVKALQDGSFVGVRCSAHILHLVVKGAIPVEKNNKIAQILDLCRKIAGHFHRSVGASQLLREEQEQSGLPIHRLKQDVSTRWNYTLEMLERILEQKTAIHNLSSRHSIGIDSTLGRDDWCIIGQLVSVLKPFRNVTENLSQSNASLGQVIPLFTYLIDKMGSFLENSEPLCGSPLHADVASFIRKLQANLKDRLNDRVRKSPELMLASLCDPRIKGKLALRDNSLSYWKEKLIERVRNLQQQRCMPDEASLEDSPAMSAIPRPGTITQKQPSGASACWVEALDNLVDAGQAAGNREESSASEMVRAYLYEAPLLPSEDPLTYWDSKKSLWPGLCLVAQQLLSCPPTTVQSERVFSITGNILNPHRAQLTPHLMEQITFLKFNLPKLGYPTLNL